MSLLLFAVALLLHYASGDITLYENEGTLTPVQGSILTTIDIVDNMVFEFDVLINSFPSGWASIFHCGNSDTIRQPGIWIHSASDNDGSAHEGFHISFSHISHDDPWINPTDYIVTGQLYSLQIQIAQSSLTVFLDGAEVYNDVGYLEHENNEAQNCYLGDPWYNAADAEVTNIKIYIPSEADDNCDHYLSQSDFDAGTYRIQSSGSYCLNESIEFNPSDSFPIDNSLYPGCSALNNGAYSLGYFTAISIETDDVEINLNDYSISMGEIFYIQQRFFSIIEIGISPFITGQGPTNFGESIEVSNVYIHDGELGLSSHNGIHGNNVQNVVVENMKINNFEVAGIQLNGFNNAKLENIIIGPSYDDVPVCGYYSNAKFLSQAMSKMIELMGTEIAYTEIVTFQGGRQLSIGQIYDNLIESMNIGFRNAVNTLTDTDRLSDLFEVSIDLYSNPMGLPDGGALYGAVFHSYGVAQDGIGLAQTNQEMGEGLELINIKIQDLALNVNDEPGAYFDACNGEGYLRNIIRGPFGDIMDLRRMVGSFDNSQIIDLGDDITNLQYVGNPLSDAQIAMSLYGSDYDTLYGTITSRHFLSWALSEYQNTNYSGLPECTQFICNGDNMYHANKGIFGVRFDLIEDIKIENIVIKRLINKSPLVSYACSNYSSAHNGGDQYELDDESGFGTDVKGIAVFGGDIIFDGYNNAIEQLVSFNGDVVGLDLFGDADVSFDYVFKSGLSGIDSDSDTDDDRSYLHIKQLCPGHEITFALLAELMVDNKYPHPNNFYACNIQRESNNVTIFPYPPNGIDNVFCADYVTDDLQSLLGNVMNIDKKEYDQYNDIIDYDDDDSLSSANSIGVIQIPSKNVNDPISKILRVKNNNNNNNNNGIKHDNPMNPDDVDKYNPSNRIIFIIIALLFVMIILFVTGTMIIKYGNYNMYDKAGIGAVSDSDGTDDEESYFK